MQYHLNGKNMSGRGVRVRELDESEYVDLTKAAASSMTSEAKVIELKRTEWRMGSKQFIVSYTDAGCKDPLDPKVKWHKADLAKFDEEFGKIFAPKDRAVLEQIFREYHEVSDQEIEAIVGKALPVSLD